jgi:predicted DNA binding protein
MPYAELTITIPEAVWIGRLSRAYPETCFRVLAATADDDTGVVRLEVLGEDAQAVVEAMGDCEPVTTLTVFESGSDHCRLQFESTVAILLTALQRSGVPLETPFEVQDGELHLATTTPRERLSALGDTLDKLGISYTLDRVTEEPETDDPVLTDRQRRLVEDARERGYYDTPRRITLTELAEELDLAASTCSEVLHRAEERLVKEHLREDRDTVPAAQPVGAD